jgi:hypothetical protein
MICYRATTHDLRSPIRGGKPIWDGSVPFRLPEVKCEYSSRQCAPGWYATQFPEEALIMASLWPDGFSARFWRVEAPDEIVVVREKKCRAPWWNIVKEESIAVALVPIAQGILCQLAPDNLALRESLLIEMQAWHTALGRPTHDAARVKAGLRAALDARGLRSWSLQQYRSMPHVLSDNYTSGLRTAFDRWSWFYDNILEGVVFSHQEEYLSCNHYLLAWRLLAWRHHSPSIRCSGEDAKRALVHWLFAQLGWVDSPADLLARGLREAYHCGLAVVRPVDHNVLGWAMLDV